MTKDEILEYLDEYDSNEEVDLKELEREYLRDLHEREAALIERLEEEQHNSGFYAFQDQMEMMRRER